MVFCFVLVCFCFIATFSLGLSSYFTKRMIFGAFIQLQNSMILHLAFTRLHPPLCPQNVRAEYRVLDPGESTLGHQMQRRQNEVRQHLKTNTFLWDRRAHPHKNRKNGREERRNLRCFQEPIPKRQAILLPHCQSSLQTTPRAQRLSRGGMNVLVWWLYKTVPGLQR